HPRRRTRRLARTGCRALSLAGRDARYALRLPADLLHRQRSSLPGAAATPLSNVRSAARRRRDSSRRWRSQAEHRRSPGTVTAERVDHSTGRLSLDWRILTAAFLAGVLAVILHHPWRQIETGDEAIWDYVSQCILRGQIPYRDVIEIKTPLSAYLSAAAMAIGRLAGTSDPVSARLLNLLMVGLLCAVTYAIACEYVRDRGAAMLAFLIPLAPTHFAEWMIGGTEPKLPMVLFGLL